MAVTNAVWIAVTAPGSGSGNGTVGLTVAANVASAQRAGTVNVLKTFAVQSPAGTD